MYFTSLNYQLFQATGFFVSKLNEAFEIISSNDNKMSGQLVIIYLKQAEIWIERCGNQFNNAQIQRTKLSILLVIAYFIPKYRT
ncbi:MAG: hypothetical protein HBSAPP04_19480 [Ignavibacteriaceae bacterium]|nr:MAG: hypothetical protein EDM75_03950 [Chlorobiota bacterium]GJQ33109.1 MAG: hypothetical protein HBSAPP04_19480 [Ignavibacteriaceae bacterium]